MRPVYASMTCTSCRAGLSGTAPSSGRESKKFRRFVQNMGRGRGTYGPQSVFIVCCKLFYYSSLFMNYLPVVPLLLGWHKLNKTSS